MMHRWPAASFALLLAMLSAPVEAAPKRAARNAVARETPTKTELLDDSILLVPAKDLTLRSEGEHRADALAHFVDGINYEENGEMENALEAYRQVLNVDPGQIELAVRVAALLSRDDDYPGAIDVLKDAVKARPNAPEPYFELAFISAKYLKKLDAAVTYANKGIGIDPKRIDGYQRLFEIYLAAGNENAALDTLSRANKTQTDDPVFWTKLGRLYSSVIMKPDATPSPEQLALLNGVFNRAGAHGHDNAGVLKEVGDYFASTQQIKEALPFYLRVLELQPDDAGVREKLATGFVLTNQRAHAIQTLDTIVREHPEKYQPYELLAQLHDDEARSLSRENKSEAATAEFKKAAENYEQSLLINPDHPATCLRLAELWLAPLKRPEKAVTLLRDARLRYPDAPEFAYYLGLALREAKKPKDAVVTFEEALNEAQNSNSDMLKPRFFLDYGAAAQEAGLFEKAAGLFRKAIALDPANAAEPYNFLGYMWAEQNMHLDQAEDAVKRALQLDPENGAYLDSMAWVQYRQGKFDQALENLQRAIQNMTREDPVVLEHLGDVQIKLSHVPQALEAWRKAKNLDPANTSIAAKIDAYKTQVSKSGPVKP